MHDIYKSSPAVPWILILQVYQVSAFVETVVHNIDVNGVAKTL